MKTSNCTNPEWSGRAKCMTCSVRGNVIFSGLELSELEPLLQTIDNFRLPAQGVLYRCGEPAAHVFTVRRGVIKLNCELPDGSQRIVRILRPGDVAGLEALTGARYQHHATALREADVCRIPLEVIRLLDQSHPDVHQALLDRWHRAVTQADQFLSGLCNGPADARLARFLLGFQCDQDPDSSFSLTRAELGGLLGITTETASRLMADFKRRGIIEVDKSQCTLRDRATLEGIASR
jgi:CRP-like cAMP-binding protein